MQDVRYRLRVFLFAMLGVMALAMAGFMWAEGLGLVDSLYFCVVTITTVGYGDIHPMSQEGKLMALVLILAGVGAFMGLVANATDLLLSRHETRQRNQKRHMVAGVFFSELGSELLRLFAAADPEVARLAAPLAKGLKADEADLELMRAEMGRHRFRLDMHYLDRGVITRLLTSKNDHLVRLLENPTLLENESFSRMLQAVFHLQEEAALRRGMAELSEADQAHLRGDMIRAYRGLSREWLEHLRHLRHHYPYLYSLAARRNPFIKDQDFTF